MFICIEIEIIVMSNSKKKQVVDLSAEELEKQENYEKNIKSVSFTPATTKEVCSPHSGSILAVDGPVVPLNDEFKEKIAKLFDDRTYFKHDIRKLLVNHFDFIDYGDLGALIDEYYGKTEQGEQMSKSDFSTFLSNFQAPGYYYGQRLRKYVARGLVKESLDLIMRGCNPNTADGEGLNALHYASEFNQIKVIKEIARICPPKLLLLNAKCKYGWTPLYCAVHHGNAGVVELLLSMGADPRERNYVGKTPLHAAAAQGRYIICELLIDSDSKKHHRGHSVQIGNRASSPGTLVDANEGESKTNTDQATVDLEAATVDSNNLAPKSSKKVNSTTNSIDKGLLNMQDKHGMTALHEAAYKGQEKVYNMLLKEKGINVDVVDALGNSPDDYWKKIEM